VTVAGARPATARLVRAGLARSTFLAALLGAAPGPLTGQDLPRGASPFLSPDHWSLAAARRLHALGLAPAGFDPASRTLTLAEAADVVRHARDAAAASGPGDSAGRPASALSPADVEALAEAYLVRLAEEYPRALRSTSVPAEPAPGVGPRSFLELTADVGYARDRGLLRGGGYTPERVWTGPSRAPDRDGPGAGAALLAGAGRHLALTARGIVEDRHREVTELALVGAWRRWGFWAGRRTPGYAPARAGSLVLDGAVGVEGAGLFLADAVALPLVGSLRAESYAGRVEANGRVERPWLWGMRLAFSPHPRLDLGVTRVAVFGGVDGAAVDPATVLRVLASTNLEGDHVDDQVASMDVRFRPPTALPVEVYGEWALHDIDLGVLVDMPAYTLGAWAPMLPGLPWAAAGLEWTSVARSCCHNPPWYHHLDLASGWTEEGVLLAHPLGGHGSELRAYLHADPMAARLLASVEGFRRDRREENLFAPDRLGVAHGVSLRLDWRLARSADVRGEAELETGEGWTASRARAALRWRP